MDFNRTLNIYNLSTHDSTPLETFMVKLIWAMPTSFQLCVKRSFEEPMTGFPIFIIDSSDQFKVLKPLAPRPSQFIMSETAQKIASGNTAILNKLTNDIHRKISGLNKS